MNVDEALKKCDGNFMLAPQPEKREVAKESDPVCPQCCSPDYIPAYECPHCHWVGTGPESSKCPRDGEKCVEIMLCQDCKHTESK